MWSRGARSRRAPAREDLNDDHPATAARTEMREWLWLTVTGSVSVTGGILWWRHIEQPTRSCEILGAIGVGEEAVVADAMEPAGQDMDQKAADELVDVER